MEAHSTDNPLQSVHVRVVCVCIDKANTAECIKVTDKNKKKDCT